MLASNLSPPPPDLTQDATQRLTDAQLFAIIRDGVRWTAMPSWREMHTDAELWQLVALVRHLPRLKLEEMDLLNPAVALVSAPECPCRSNVKTAIGVCGECKAGWDAGVGAIEDVDPQSVQQIKGDMLKMMYSMRGPREQMVAPTTVAGGHQHSTTVAAGHQH